MSKRPRLDRTMRYGHQTSWWHPRPGNLTRKITRGGEGPEGRPGEPL